MKPSKIIFIGMCEFGISSLYQSLYLLLLPAPVLPNFNHENSDDMQTAVQSMSDTITSRADQTMLTIGITSLIEVIGMLTIIYGVYGLARNLEAPCAEKQE